MLPFSAWFADQLKSRREVKPARSQRGSRRQNRLAVEQLESRRLLAVTETFAAGVLAFQGDATDDALLVQMSGFTATFNLGAGPQSQGGVASITFDGGGGNNSFELDDLSGNAILGVNGANLTYSAAITGGFIIPVALTDVQTLALDDASASGIDTFNVQSTALATTISSDSAVGQDTFNVSSDAPTNTGNTSGIASPLEIDAGSGANTLVVSDAGGTTSKSVTLTDTDITGMTPTPSIAYSDRNGTLALTLTGSSTTATTFTVNDPVGAGNTVTLNGGAAPDTFNIQAATADSVTVNPGAGANVVNVSSDAPTNAGNTAGVTSVVNVNAAATGSTTLNASDAGDAAADTVTLTNAAITGISPAAINYTVASGGVMNIALQGPNAAGSTFTVASTQASGAVTLTGGSAGGNIFNIQSAIATRLQINTGNGAGNAVQLSSAPYPAPIPNTGITAGITAAVTVAAGTGANSLVVDDNGGAAADNVTLTSSSISGFTPTPIVYATAAGGTLTVGLAGPNAHATTFTVTSTLPNNSPFPSVVLLGGNAGGNTFNIGSAGPAGANTVSALGGTGQLSDLPAEIGVIGGTGTGNKLEVNDHGSTGMFNYDINATTVTTDATSPRTFGGVTYSGIQTVQLDATEQQNQINVTASATTAIIVNAYGPMAPPNVPAGTGDSLAVNGSGVTGAVLTKTAVPAGGNSYNGTWTFTNRKTITFTSIEEFDQPAIAIGADAAGNSQPFVKVYDSSTGALLTSFMAYETTFHGGVHVAVGYFDGTGVEEVAVAPGLGRAPLVKIYNLNGVLQYSFMAYASTFINGVNIAAGYVEGAFNGTAPLDDIVTSPMRGVSDIRDFQNKRILSLSNPPFSGTPKPFREFTAWSKTFIGGSTVAVADVTESGHGEIIVGSGSGMQSLIEAFDVSAAATGYSPVRIYYPFDPSYRGGVNVSAISIQAGVASPMIIASQNIAGTSLVRVFNAFTGVSAAPVQAYTGASDFAPVHTVPEDRWRQLDDLHLAGDQRHDSRD